MSSFAAAFVPSFHLIHPDSVLAPKWFSCQPSPISFDWSPSRSRIDQIICFANSHWSLILLARSPLSWRRLTVSDSSAGLASQTRQGQMGLHALVGFWWWGNVKCSVAEGGWRFWWKNFALFYFSQSNLDGERPRKSDLSVGLFSGSGGFAVLPGLCQRIFNFWSHIQRGGLVFICENPK